MKVQSASHTEILTLPLAANTLNVNLAGSATGAADLSSGLTVTGSAVINVKSTGTDGQPNNMLKLTAADNQSVVVTGSQNLTLTAFNAPSTTGFSIDASAFTGKLNVTGTNDTDTIKGGSGADVIDGGTVTHNAAAVVATNEVQTLTIGQFSGTANPAADMVSVTISGTTVTTAVVDLADKAAVATAIATAVNANGTTNLIVAAVAGTDNVTFTYKGASAAQDVAAITFAGNADSGAGNLAATVVETTKGAAAAAGTAGTVDTLTGGAGADTFVFSTADVATLGGAVNAIITDFVSGTDKIQVNSINAAGSATNYVEASAAATTLAALLTAADTALNGTVKYYVGQVGADSYVVTDNDGTGYTNVVKLTGVALDGIAATDFFATPI